MNTPRMHIPTEHQIVEVPVRVLLLLQFMVLGLCDAKFDYPILTSENAVTDQNERTIFGIYDLTLDEVM